MSRPRESRAARCPLAQLVAFGLVLTAPLLLHAADSGPAPSPAVPVAATFPYTQAPLQPEIWPAYREPVNRDRVYDFYAKQAAWLAAQPPAERPKLVIEYPGLDGGKYGHWGNQNDETWRDARWNDTDLGRVAAGILRGGGKTVAKGVSVLLGDQGEMACCFDPLTLTYPLVWRGGFVVYDAFRHGICQNVKITGTVVPMDAGKPAQGFVYHGYYRSGNRVIFSYRREGVEMLDSPWVKDGQFVREVGPAAASPLASLVKGGPAQWPQTVETRGKRGTTAPFAVDTVTLPFENPWKSLFFIGGHDFLPNGDGVICTIMGEVWTVSGLDENLEHLRWRRIATGLSQPLGLRVVDGLIYVLGRDQITRLHDLNGDGEIDFYECFSNAYTSAPGAHEFITGLERDTNGYWSSVSANQGIFRLSPDGQDVEEIARGFRNPNGVALAPDGTVVTSCQEGDWTPASQLCLIPPGVHGLFFGYGGPRPDRPTTPPLLYLPRGVDNSTGGPCFVDTDHWAVPRGSLLSTSWGTGSAFLILREKVDDVWQAAAIQLPGEFRSGAHRARFHPQDGQLYVSGCQGWGSYTPDDGCFQRLRWTGAPTQLPTEIHARDNGVLLHFSLPLDHDAATNAREQIAMAWNYRYAKAYGSPEFSTRHPAVTGHDLLEVTSAHVLADGLTLFLEIPQLQPCNQLYLHINLGSGQSTDVYATPHRLGPVFTDFPGYQAIAKVPRPVTVPTVVPPSTPNPWATGPSGRLVRIETANGMQFATKRFTVKAGERITLTLVNPDTMPHNIAILKPGTMARVGDGVNHMAAQPDGAAKRYVPEGSDVLFFTDITDPGKSATIHFTAPTAPGEYPYICTFPGHWLLMNGVMVVE
jgi:azurin